jgi:nicotinamidase/pyrazinamidase
MSKSALIVVDVQRDFCEGGALAAADTLSILEPLAKSVETARQKGTVIVYTRDWHPNNHSSFKTQGGPWPVHCVAESKGAELMPPLHPRQQDIVVSKGVAVQGAGYSGFEDTGLAQKLKDLQVEKVAVTGIATEYCVRATALDAKQAGFETTVLTDLIRAVNPREASKVLNELHTAGVQTEPSNNWRPGP